MNLAQPSELRDRTRSRDAQDVRTYEVRFNDVDAFLDDVKADAARGSIEDGILRLSIVKAPASVGDVYRADPGRADKGDLDAFDKRRSSYDRVMVDASYIARGQMVKFSRSCGITIDLKAPILLRASAGNRSFAADRTRECAEAIDELVHKIQREVKDLGLDVRGGGLYVESGPWHHDPEHNIASFPRETCGVCDAVLYFANGHWRDETGRFEVVTDAGFRPGTRLRRTRLDHVHAPKETAL